MTVITETKPMETIRLINHRQLAAIVGVHPDTIAKEWRPRGRGPRGIKLTASKQGRVLYDMAEVEEWKRDPQRYESQHRGERHGDSN